MKFLNATEFMSELPKILKYGGIIGHRANTPLCHIGMEKDYNEFYCIENNIPIFKVRRIGGAIVSNTGDFDFVVVGKKDKKWLEGYKPELLNKIISLLQSRNHNAWWDHNDLLVNGYKVASYSYREVSGGVYVAMHISMSVDITLIMNICKKPMVKVPKGLNDFGIYEEDILKIIEDLNEELV